MGIRIFVFTRTLNYDKIIKDEDKIDFRELFMTYDEYFDEDSWERFSERKPIQKGDDDTCCIDITPEWLELSEALSSKEYRLLRIERLYPADADIFLVKVQDTKPIGRKPGTLENPIRQVCLDGFY
jgi:hypothetical protein